MILLNSMKKIKNEVIL